MGKELKIAKIYEEDQYIGYGGNQDWFDSEWAQRAGCASVCAANMVAYYIKRQEYYTKTEFVALMKEMYSIMEPKKRGFPYAYLYKERLCHYLKNHGQEMNAQIIRQWYCVDMVLEWVKKSIDRGDLVALLILHHLEPRLEEDNWHWVCITGYERINGELYILFSDCGIKKKIEASVLFDPDPRNCMKLVLFNKTI